MAINYSDGLNLESQCRDIFLSSKTSQKYEEFINATSNENLIELTKEKTPYRRLLLISLIPFALTGSKFNQESLLALYNMEQSINPIETTGMAANIHQPSIFHIPADIFPGEKNRLAAPHSYCYFKPIQKISVQSIKLVRRRLCLSFQEFAAEFPQSSLEEYANFIITADKISTFDENMILLFSSFVPLIKSRSSKELFGKVYDKLSEHRRGDPLINMSLAN
jgi:hypothetical protein